MKFISRVISVVLACASLFLVGCKSGGSSSSTSAHKHNFVCKIRGEQFEQTAATCQGAAVYYYSCVCGEKGEKTFEYGNPIDCDFSAKVEDDKYVIATATCGKYAKYYYSCGMCGAVGEEVFASEKLGDHYFTEEKAEVEYLKTEATFKSAEVYYKSCVCGAKGEDTFIYGEPLREYSSSEKLAYKPTSLTVTLYDAESSIYGFTYNTEAKPLRPVLQVSKNNDFSNYEEYYAKVMEASSYRGAQEKYTYYVVKVDVALDPLSTYTYRVYDKYVGVGTETVVLETKDTKTRAFSFAHLSDSQVGTGDTVGAGSGEYFGKVLSKVVGVNDFIVHTGDVVEDPRYESFWTHMLDDNFSYLSKIPIMTISGNHETTYLKCYNETFKHFHNKLPEQASTESGYFYSFIYGNAKFIMLNTNELSGNALKAEQYNWLVKELKNNTSDWTFVALHNPIYSVGKWGADPSKNQISLALRSQLTSIFAEYGVDIVLQGHDHCISRTYPINANGGITNETLQTENGVDYSIDPNGVIYVMNGPAGSHTRNPSTLDKSYYSYAEGSKASSWAEFAIDGNTLRVAVKYTDGTTIGVYYEWGIKKSA